MLHYEICFTINLKRNIMEHCTYYTHNIAKHTDNHTCWLHKINQILLHNKQTKCVAIVVFFTILYMNNFQN